MKSEDQLSAGLEEDLTLNKITCVRLQSGYNLCCLWRSENWLFGDFIQFYCWYINWSELCFVKISLIQSWYYICFVIISLIYCWLTGLQGKLILNFLLYLVEKEQAEVFHFGPCGENSWLCLCIIITATTITTVTY